MGFNTYHCFILKQSIVMNKRYTDICTNGEWTQREVTTERDDGSSDWLFEALDIEVWDGYKGCSNWEDFDKIGSLEDLFPEIKEPTAEELIAEYLRDHPEE